MSAPTVMGTMRPIGVFVNLPRPLFSHFPGTLMGRALTPVNLTKMLPWLERYPNRRMAALLIEGFRDVFLVPSFKGKGCAMVQNLKPAHTHSSLVQDKISKELADGRIAGPFSVSRIFGFRR